MGRRSVSVAVGFLNPSECTISKRDRLSTGDASGISFPFLPGCSAFVPPSHLNQVHWLRLISSNSASETRLLTAGVISTPASSERVLHELFVGGPPRGFPQAWRAWKQRTGAHTSSAPSRFNMAFVAEACGHRRSAVNREERAQATNGNRGAFPIRNVCSSTTAQVESVPSGESGQSPQDPR